MVAAERVGGDRANFIHLEVYPQRDANRPTPLYQAWSLRSVPWTVVIGPDGHISARYSTVRTAAVISAAATGPSLRALMWPSGLMTTVHGSLRRPQAR